MDRDSSYNSNCFGCSVSTAIPASTQVLSALLVNLSCNTASCHFVSYGPAGRAAVGLCLCNTSRLPLCLYPWQIHVAQFTQAVSRKSRRRQRAFASCSLSTWLSRSTPWVGCQQQDLPSRELSTGKYAFRVTKITAHRGIYILSSAPVFSSRAVSMIGTESDAQANE